jgi:FkbM family methyltransferase
MPDTFVPRSEVEWVEQLVCDRYKVKIPKFLADYNQWWGDWEKVRFASMEANLKKGDVLYDIGSENGWVSAIYAQFVGAENMCLFEPCAELWPNIKETWYANDLPIPLLAAPGFLSDIGKGSFGFWSGQWPGVANAASLLANTKFQHLDENPETPSAAMDDLVDMLGSRFTPDAITIDVEGAELSVLQGAQHTLEDARPLVWVSLHQGYVNRPGVHILDQDVFNFMNAMGYENEFLGADHERHIFFRPR